MKLKILIAIAYITLALGSEITSFRYSSAMRKKGSSNSYKISHSKSSTKFQFRKMKEAIKLTNSEWIVIGYNIYKGNPMFYPSNIPMDAGFTLKIFKLEFDTSRNTSDKRYQMPIGYDVQPAQNCNGSMTNKSLSTSSKLKTELSVSVGVKVTYGLSFGVNTDFTSTSDNLQTGKSIVIVNSASCSVYRALFENNAPPKLEDSFVSEVKKLIAVGANEETVYNFINTYGTHYQKEIIMGSKMTYTSIMDSSTASELSSTGISVELSVSKKISGVEVAGTATAGGTETVSEKIDKSTQKVYAVSIGSTLKDLDINTWIKESKGSPMPINYKLGEIKDLFLNNFIRQDLKTNHKLSDEQISQIYIKLNNGYGDYCKRYLVSKGLVSSCEIISKITSSSEKTEIRDNDSFSKLFDLNINCNGAAIKYFRYIDQYDDKFQYDYKCSISEYISKNCFNRQTQLGSYISSKGLENLDPIDLKCPSDSVLTQFKIVHKDNKVLGEYKCCEAEFEKRATTTSNQVKTSSSISKLKDLYFNKDTDEYTVLQGWNFIYKDGGNMYYSYDYGILLKK